MNSKIFLLSIAALAGLTLYIASQATTDTGLVNDAFVLTQFNHFRREYARTYNSPEEYKYRLGVFRANLEMIEAHNAGNSSYTLEINKFGDMTDEEFAAKYYGTIDVPLSSSEFSSAEPKLLDLNDVKEVDWVKAGVVTAVKDQRVCASSWAFSSIGAVESAYAIFLKQNNFNLSEQELIDCSSKSGNRGCESGSISNALSYIYYNGINHSKDYPYTGVDGKCLPIGGKGPNHIKTYKETGEGLQKIIDGIRIQPVAVAFHGKFDLRYYKNGIYSPTKCIGEVQHAVLAVGFKLDTATPYFYLKNSWGADWGQNGFMYMAMGGDKATDKGTCNIAGNNFSRYPVVN